jgi:hypothetical protein
MLKSVPLLIDHRGGDGRFRAGYMPGSLAVHRILYTEYTGRQYDDRPITLVHLDDGTDLEVLLSIDQINGLANEED